MDALPGVVRRNLSTHCDVPVATPLLVAVSGGCDSVALLHALARQPARYRAAHVVAHVDHGWREESRDDAIFVERLAERLGFRCVRTRLKPDQDSGGESREMWARRRRHAFLASTARELALGTVALAHQADDQVELFLLRLFRGAGGIGLGGMRWVSPSPADPGVILARPLLSVARTGIATWLGRIGESFREDGSNRDLSIPRNAIRHQLLPLLRDFAGPGLDAALLRAADLTGADADCVREWAEGWMASHESAGFETLHRAVQRAVIRETLIRLGQEPDYDLIERLRLKPGGGTSAHGGVNWVRQPGTAGISRVVAATTRAGPTSVTGGKRIRLAGKRGSVELGDATLLWSRSKPPRQWSGRVDGDEWFDPAGLGDEVQVRRWEPGDRYRPLGGRGSIKLQDVFTNARVPRGERARRWVGVVGSGEIFWVEGMPPGEDFKVVEGMETAIRWRLRRGLGR